MEKLACCPFNSSHAVEKAKLTAHINRCKEKIKYPYNKVINCKASGLFYLDVNDKIHLEECEHCFKNSNDQTLIDITINLSLNKHNIINTTNLDESSISFNESSMILPNENKEGILDNSNIY